MATIKRDHDGLPVVTLTNAEARYCETVGHLRHCENIGRPNAHSLRHDGRDEETIGAYGEYVVSIFTNRSWQAVVDNPWTDINGDVDNFQVRTASVATNTSLILHDRDPDDALFILVRRIKGYTQFRIEGWLPAHEGKNERYWADRARINRPAYFVPSEDLYHPDTLPMERTLSPIG